MKTKERELANKIAAHWYDNLHMQHAPIFQKQKLSDFVETELKTLGLFSVRVNEMAVCDDEIHNTYRNYNYHAFCPECGKEL